MGRDAVTLLSLFVRFPWRFPRARVWVLKGRAGSRPRQFCFRVDFGWRPPPFNMGSGYRGGATLYFAWNCPDCRAGGNIYTNRRIQFGFNRSGSLGSSNRVPYTNY